MLEVCRLGLWMRAGGMPRGPVAPLSVFVADVLPAPSTIVSWIHTYFAVSDYLNQPSGGG